MIIMMTDVENGDKILMTDVENDGDNIDDDDNHHAAVDKLYITYR